MWKANGAKTSAPALIVLISGISYEENAPIPTSAQILWGPQLQSAVNSCTVLVVLSATLSSSLRVNKKYGNSLSYLPLTSINNNYISSRQTPPNMQTDAATSKSQSREANWTLQRPDLSSPHPSARMWCNGNKAAMETSKLGYLTWIYLDLMMF